GQAGVSAEGLAVERPRAVLECDVIAEPAAHEPDLELRTDHGDAPRLVAVRRSTLRVHFPARHPHADGSLEPTRRPLRTSEHERAARVEGPRDVRALDRIDVEVEVVSVAIGRRDPDGVMARRDAVLDAVDDVRPLFLAVVRLDQGR